MKSLKIFISYSRQDEEYKDQLITHLSPLKKLGVVEEWHDRKLIPGEDWDGTIKKELIDSDIILLLVSSNFIASNYAYDVEITKAIELHEKRKVTLIPIILRPCDWKDLPFSKIQVLPQDGKPLSTWPDIDEGYLNIIEGIKAKIKIGSSRTKIEVDEMEETENLFYDEDVVICRLPRGYLVLNDIEFKEDAGWAVTAHHYDYGGNWRHGTHYHESYHRRWDTPEGQDSQCKKLNIQRGDWSIATSVLYLIMKIRERKSTDKIEDLLADFRSDYEYFDYYKQGEEIPTPTVPEKFTHLNKTGKIRDIIEELSLNSWKDYDLKILHERFESNRRKASLILYEKLPSNHPALTFVNKIVDEYKPEFDLEKLKAWSVKLSDALLDACLYIK